MKLRVAILTSIPNGTASRVLEALLRSNQVDVAGAVLVHAPARRRYRIKPKKIRRIGILGALNGLRLRRWYREADAPDIRSVCAAAGIPCIETDSTNGEQTQKAMEAFGAHLGLSLGNSYIHPRIFGIPRHGMINLHGELLPEFKGAQSVIWSIYEGKTVSGLTIHQISDAIDGGDILYRQEIPIRFMSSLRSTVEKTTEATRAAVPRAILYVCENYDELHRRRAPQSGGKRYTTPSFGEFLRMVAKHRRLRSRYAADRNFAGAQ